MSTDNQSLVGTSVVVTGAGRGLGLAMTTDLAAAGADILAVDIDEEPLRPFGRGKLANVVGFRADVSDEDDAGRIVGAAEEHFGRVDVLVNCAGVNLVTLSSQTAGGPTPVDPSVPFHELATDSVRRLFEVHVVGSFLLSRAVTPGMVSRGFGRIIYVSTSLGTMFRAKGAPYGPVKAAMEAFAGCAAADLADTPVTVNVLIPGGAAATRFVTPGRPTDQLIDPAVMGPPAVWLASADSAGFTARRLIAKDWDPARPPAEAADAASTPIGWPTSWPR